MTGLNCKPKEFRHKERCCDICLAGQYVRTACDNSTKTKCETCIHDHFTESENFMLKCIACRVCDSNNHQRTFSPCKANRNAQCECVAGYYCEDNDCVHCLPVTQCPLGSGVIKDARRRNTECAPCQSGTYSNVKDAVSQCHNHTRCGELGREMITAGTPKTDAVCGPIIQCSWILPGSLWAGLTVTSILIILFCIFYWRAKRQSYMTALSRVPGMSAGAAPSTYPEELPLYFSENKGHYQESFDQKGTQPLFFNPAEIQGYSCTQDCDVESDGPTMTTMTVSERFGQSNHINGIRENGTSSSPRILSEPEEDEWPGS